MCSLQMPTADANAGADAHAANAAAAAALPTHSHMPVVIASSDTSSQHKPAITGMVDCKPGSDFAAPDRIALPTTSALVQEAAVAKAVKDEAEKLRTEKLSA